MAPPSPRPRVRAPVQTRARLLACARARIEEDGYAAASVAAIATAANTSPGALYRHWPSKGALVAELFRTVCDAEIVAMEDAAAQAQTAADAVTTVLTTFAARALVNPRLAWALLAEPVDPLVEAERLDYRRRYAAALAEALAGGIAGGELPPQDAHLTAAALVGGVGEALVGPLSPLAEGGPDRERILAALQAFARRAIGAPE